MAKPADVLTRIVDVCDKLNCRVDIGGFKDEATRDGEINEAMEVLASAKHEIERLRAEIDKWQRLHPDILALEVKPHV